MKSIKIECKPYYLFGVNSINPLRINSMDECYINGKKVTRQFFELICSVTNNMVEMLDEIPDFLTNKYDSMSAKVKITGKLSKDIFAQFEGELISDNSITAAASAEGQSEITKTANKGDIVVIDITATPDFKPEIGHEYYFHFLPSLYAKNNQKPLVLHTTVIL